VCLSDGMERDVNVDAKFEVLPDAILTFDKGN